MRRELALYLLDMRDAGLSIVSFVRDRSFAEYESDDMLRSAVERKYTIIGEALNQALQQYPQMRSRIREDWIIVNFRHRIIHGYFSMNNDLVWSITRTELPDFILEVEALLTEFN